LPLRTDELIGGVEPNERVRTAMAYALGDAMAGVEVVEEDIGRALDALIEAASDEVGDVRIAAINSLLRVSWPDEQSDINSLLRISWPDEQSDRVEQILTQAQADPHYWVRYAVAPES